MQAEPRFGDLPIVPRPPVVDLPRGATSGYAPTVTGDEGMRMTLGARRLILMGILLLVATMAQGRLLRAQQFQGTVRDSASQQPLPGVVVLILDPTGRPAARGTTDQLGRFRLASTLRRSATRLRLRVLRMGFRPYELPLAGAATGTAIDIALVSFPILLDVVEIQAPPGCPRRPDRAAALGLLQQVRTALYATVLARSHNSATMTRRLFARRFDGATGRVASQTVKVRVTSGTNESFSAARSASAFGRQGFQQDSAGSHAYVGPDAETLIDDAFTERYCFRLIAPDQGRPRQVGLGFEPPYREAGRIDIVGTLWVDTLSRVLQDLSFRYVGLDRETSALAPEGRLSFRELPNGVVLIDQWSLRLAGLRSDGGSASSGAAEGSDGAPRPRAQEIGGEIVRASWPDGYTWRAPLGTIRLRTVDGQGRPAAASVVQLVDTDYQATAESPGTVVLTDLLPGPYTASIRDPRLASLGIRSGTSLRVTAVRDSTIEARAEVETADELAGKRCGYELTVAGRGRLLGRVVTPDGRPVKDARWTVRDEVGSVLVEGGRVDDDGLFHWCQLPLNKGITVDVGRDDRRVFANHVVRDELTTLRFVLP